MYKNLIDHIEKYVRLKDTEAETVCDCFGSFSLNNKAFLLNEGEVCKSYYFTAKGCLRMFFYNDKGMEQTVQFALENWWLTDLFSFMDQIPSSYSVQAIEKSEILAVDAANYNRLQEEVPVLERYFRIMSQRALAAYQFRMKLIYSLSKEDMYRHFASSFPQFVQRIPQYMLASYLGLTPEYLSELRKKVR